MTVSQSFRVSVTTDEMRKRMGEILDCVNLRGDEFVIERKRNPLAVLVPFQKHQLLMSMARKNILSTLDRLHHCSLSQDEIDTLANDAKHESRNNTTLLDIK